MNKKIQSITTVLTLLIFISFSIIFLFLDKKEFSENENRVLESVPKYSFHDLKSGKYISKWENYMTDHFPFRDTWMGIKTVYQRLLGYQEMNGVYIGKEETLFQKYQPPKNTDQLVTVLNDFYHKNDIPMYLMLVPTSGVIYPEKLPNHVNFDNQLQTLQYIYEKVDMKKVNVYDSLLDGKDNGNMFYRLDHHWTTLGAYYGYLAYCKENGIEPVPLSNYQQETVTNGFNGTLYSKANIYTFQPDSMERYISAQQLEVNYVYSNKVTNTLYEDSHLQTKDKYAMFLDGNHPLIQIKTDVERGKNLLILKDSYANSLIPFLTNHYTNIHVLDMRFYNDQVSQYILDNKIDEVLILYNMNGIDEDLGIYNIR